MKRACLLLLCCLLGSRLSAQDDLLAMLDSLQEADQKREFTHSTFKTVRVVNAHSIEIPAPGVLQMAISHRFGRLNGGFYEFFGLDQANMRMGFEYGLNNHLCLGVGRSNVRKTYDGFLKLKLMRQSSGKVRMPFTIVALSGIGVNTLRWTDPDRPNYFTSRLSYWHQLMIARKFNSRLSLQFMPTMVHRNLVATRREDNDVFALGAGGRYRVTGSMTLNAEYFFILPTGSHTANNYQNSLSVGVDLETGGHVFQLMLTNSLGMTENLFVAETDGDWLQGDIHFGFNLMRVFTVSEQAHARAQKAEGW
jgi:hypothetical protein